MIRIIKNLVNPVNPDAFKDDEVVKSQKMLFFVIASVAKQSLTV